MTTLVYDGDCGFCTSAVRWVARLRLDPGTVAPWQTADLPSLGLTRQQCEEKLQWVADGGRVSSGHEAVARLLLHSALPWRLPGALLLTPPLSWLADLSGRGVGGIGVKLSPAIDHALAGRFGAELEFLSEGGECREALLWLGTARSGDALRATVITPSGPRSLTGAEDTPGQPSAAGGRYLYEPDPAVIRAHLVRTLARQLGAAPADPQIAYLLGDALIFTPFADAYEVLDRFPYGNKRLQKALTSRDVGRVIIKKRGFPQEPDEVRKQLKLRGPEEMIVVLARVGKGHEVFLCRLVKEAALSLQNETPRD